MGIWFSHNCFSGGYGKFHTFRCVLAKAIHIPLEAMEGFFIKEDWLVAACGNNLGQKLLERRLEGFPLSWDLLGDDPLRHFLSMSDIEGTIPHRLTLPLARRLEELAPILTWPSEWRKDWDFQKMALDLAQGLRRAHEAEESVSYS